MMPMNTCIVALLASLTLLACSRAPSTGAASGTEPAIGEGAPGQAEPVATTASMPGAGQGPVQQPGPENASQPVQSDAVTAQGDPCDGMDAQLTGVRKRDYASLVSEAMGRKVRPGKVDVSMFTESGTWSVVLASSPIADPGYFFFESVDGKKKFKDVWAGVAEQDDVPEVVAWVESLGAPEAFARCFATMIPIAG